MTREQFIRYVEQEQEQLRRFLLALCCGNREEADDIAQDTLVKAYLSSERYRDEGKFTAWLYKIAHNTFLDRKRHTSTMRNWKRQNGNPIPPLPPTALSTIRNSMPPLPHYR